MISRNLNRYANSNILSHLPRDQSPQSVQPKNPKSQTLLHQLKLKNSQRLLPPLGGALPTRPKQQSRLPSQQEHPPPLMPLTQLKNFTSELKFSKKNATWPKTLKKVFVKHSVNNTQTIQNLTFSRIASGNASN